MDLARSLHAQIALIYAIDPSSFFAPNARMAADELALTAERDGTRVMADFRARLPTGIQALQFIPQGQAGTEIIKAAGKWEADPIVIGSYGRRGITWALVGTVVEAVIRHAPCPILIVRAKG